MEEGTKKTHSCLLSFVVQIKSLTVQLWQTSVLYHPSLSSTRPNSAHTGVDPGSTSTKQKKVAETVLQEAQASGVGRITGKGWFTGCGPMTAGAWSTSLLLPVASLSNLLALPALRELGQRLTHLARPPRPPPSSRSLTL